MDSNHLECFVAAILATAGNGSTSMSADAMVKRYTDMLRSLRKVGGANEVRKRTFTSESYVKRQTK